MMVELRQKLLMDLFRKFRNDNFHKGTGSYQPGRRLSQNAKPIDRVYQTVDRYLELGYTENIIEYYKKLHLAPLEERAFQRQKDDRVKKTREQKEKNLKFIEENGLVEHPNLRGYYGAKDGRVFSSSGAYGAIRKLKPIYQKYNNGYYLIQCGRDENGKPYQIGWHRFIAEIFISNPNNLSDVNHIDKDKSNNAVINLEWSTHKDNCIHSRDDCARNTYIITNIKTNETYEINNLNRWCEENSVHRSSTFRVMRGECKHTKGYSIKKVDKG